jgi:hypothetical protein
VKYIPTNTVCAGANVYGRHKHGDTRVRDRAEWQVVTGTREPMVPPDVSERVQESIRSQVSAERTRAFTRPFRAIRPALATLVLPCYGINRDVTARAE